jgi:hypothetical protein
MRLTGLASVTALLWTLVVCRGDLTAQGLPTSIRVQVFRAADPLTGLPFRELTVPLSDFTCNLAPLASPPLPWRNITTIEVIDPARPTRQCRPMATSASRAELATFFAGLPSATGYQLLTTYRYTSGESGVSNRSGPFQRTAGTPCGVNLAGRQVVVLLSSGQITSCVEPR